MRALSIRQPWAWLIVQGHKPVENREWTTHYRGPLLIHASATVAKRDYELTAAMVDEEFGITVPKLEVIERGGVVGLATLADCVQEMDNPWFTGPCGFVLTGAKPLPFLPWKGGLGYFHVPAAALGLPAEVMP